MKQRNASLMEKIVRQEQQRIINSGESWMHLGGNVTAICKVIYFIASIYLLLVNLAYILSIYLSIEDAKIYPDSYNMVSLRSAMLVTSVLTAAIIAAVVFMILRKYFAVLLFSLPSAVLLCIFFYGESSKNRLQNGSGRFILQHIVPAIIFALTILIIYLISRKDKRRVKMLYERAESALYEQYKSQHSTVSSDEWKEYMRTYNAYADENKKAAKWSE